MKRKHIDGDRNARESLKAPFDVVVTHADRTALFAPQNRRASEWLHRRCGLSAESISGNTEIRVHPTLRSKIVEELKAAGFKLTEDGGTKTK